MKIKGREFFKLLFVRQVKHGQRVMLFEMADPIINFGFLTNQHNSFRVMLDESSIIQNETAKRSKFILKMQPENVILEMADPIINFGFLTNQHNSFRVRIRLFAAYKCFP